jgi:hypothetical protein
MEKKRYDDLENKIIRMWEKKKQKIRYAFQLYCKQNSEKKDK